MKLLILSRYDRRGASSRLRMMQYASALEADGIRLEFAPFFDDAYLDALYAGRRSIYATPAYYLRRIRQLLRNSRPDAVWLEKEALPWMPYTLERLLLPSGVPVVSDYDDAVFHRYDLHGSGLVRRLLGRKIDRIMSNSSLVMAGNPYLGARARTAGAGRVEIVPTVVDANAYATDPLPAADGRLRIGWIGTPSTWTQYMVPLLPMLSDIAQRHGALIRSVGGTATKDDRHLEVLPWHEEEESRLIQGMDIGLMPLDDSPWSRGKCGYKIIQYMACGLPVVASPVGVNAEIVEPGVTGFLATTEAEWRNAIERLLADPDLRRRMGAAGRRRMEERYSLQAWAPRVAALLRQVAEAGARRSLVART
ncbi:MAG: glycosyltransferase family 4 protein [Devosia sp.]